MDFERVVNNNHVAIQTWYPESLSRKLVMEVESKIILPPLNPSDTSIPVLFVWMAILGLISWTLLESLQKLGSLKIPGLSVLPSPQTPCKNCAFYAHNPYLKCAVHPTRVLTKEASNCSDYYSICQ